MLATGLLGIYPAAINYVELAGRKPAHTFLDFSTAFVLTAIPCALALTGSGPHTDFTCVASFTPRGLECILKTQTRDCKQQCTMHALCCHLVHCPLVAGLACGSS